MHNRSVYRIILFTVVASFTFMAFTPDRAFAATEKGARCSDGVDNDGDGFIDDDDPDCSTFDDLPLRVAELENQVEALLALLGGITRLDDPNTGQDTLRLTGMNLQVVNGAGVTGEFPDGTGNVIIGYNELSLDTAPESRTGSHMLVIGTQNSYSSFGGMVVGSTNTASGSFASVSGGFLNEATGSGSSVSGGIGNIASGGGSSISGGSIALLSPGQPNEASGFGSSINGGRGNKASGRFSSISGGELIEISEDYGAVSGPPGADGLDGATGPEGPEGPEGPAGPVGPQGPAGLAGADGQDGRDGPRGPEGPAGPVGPEGPDGPEGPEGPTGADGQDAEWPIYSFILVAPGAPCPPSFDRTDIWASHIDIQSQILEGGNFHALATGMFVDLEACFKARP